MVVPLEILRCPVDRGLLRAERDSLVCEACDRHFPVVDGTPVLIDGERSLFTIDEVAESRTARDRRSILERIAYRLRPSPTDNPGAPERFRRFRDLVRASAGGPRARILVVGGGALGSGMQAIDGDPDLEFVDTDVYLNERVRVACDAHQLPFADGAFDGAIVQAVLEHVVAPQEVVAEIHRVLKPGGLVYAETPFMQAVHEGAYDFTRFTDLGHRRLFRMFEEVERGVAVGPGTSLFWAIRYFVSRPATAGRDGRTTPGLRRLVRDVLAGVARSEARHARGRLRRGIRRVLPRAPSGAPDRRSGDHRRLPRGRRWKGDRRARIPPRRGLTRARGTSASRPYV